ncbi:MAG: hypothetical protein WEF28_09590 [Acidimicrobiia bacterium]
MSTAAAVDKRRFSLAHLILAIPWVALVIDAFAPIGDNSFLWHVRAGSLQLEQGRVLTTDPFSFTAGGETWLTQSWLVEIIYARFEGMSGLGFVPWLLLGITALTFVGIGLIAFKASQSVMATAVVLVLSTVSLISFLVPRPVIFSYLLFVLVILGWERKSSRWTLPFLFWIWASVHGSFFLGLAYVGLRLLTKKEWRAMPFPVVSGLVTLFTPHGWGVVQMLGDFVTASPHLSLLTEWRTPELFSPVFFPVFVGIVLIIYGATRQRLVPLDLLLIVPFFALSLTALRSVPPAWLALLVPVSLSLQGSGRQLPKRFGFAASAIFVTAVAVVPFLLVDHEGLATDRFPVALAESLDGSRMFHNDVVGGFLIWHSGPDLQVFIDDRAELYQERMQEYVDVRSGNEPWEPLFERYGIIQALLGEDEAMVQWLTDAGWAVAGEEEGFVLLAES